MHRDSKDIRVADVCHQSIVQLVQQPFTLTTDKIHDPHGR